MQTFSKRKDLWCLYGSWGFLWVSLSGLPHRHGENTQAELQQRLDFSFVILQWGCGYLWVFVHSMVHIVKRGGIPGVNKELLRKGLFAFCEIFVCNSQVCFQASAKNWENTFIYLRQEWKKKIKQMNDHLFQCSAQGAHCSSNLFLGKKIRQRWYFWTSVQEESQV